MTTFLNISMSLDGFVAGLNQTLEQPLGEGGEELHEWAVNTEEWRRQHGLEGGESGVDGELIRAAHDRTGAFVMGRRMFSGGAGLAWDDDPKSTGWWGDEPPFHMPVFVFTHHARKPLEMEGGTTFHFVTDGIHAALQRAKDAARGKDITLGGGADLAQQHLKARLVDEMDIHIVPVLLGNGTRLFDNSDGRQSADGSASDSWWPPANP